LTLDERNGDITSLGMEARRELHRELGQPLATTAEYAEPASAEVGGSAFLAVLTLLPEAVVQLLQSHLWAWWRTN